MVSKRYRCGFCFSQQNDSTTDHSYTVNGDDTPADSDSKSVVSSATGSTTVVGDDPSQFQSLKIKKNTLQEGIRQFNAKPKKGIKALIDTALIKSSDAEEIAKFLLTTEGLDKAVIGEYLGEGDQENIKIMHHFVDLIDFTDMKFVDALRLFLQAFRLPGESQKIDRFLLKFSERYVRGNPDIFVNATTAYVLSYSVIMLNTDLHNPQIKKRMTLDEFIRNNRGINDDSDLPRELLVDIYNEIQQNEIKLCLNNTQHLLQTTVNKQLADLQLIFLTSLLLLVVICREKHICRHLVRCLIKQNSF